MTRGRGSRRLGLIPLVLAVLLFGGLFETALPAVAAARARTWAGSASAPPPRKALLEARERIEAHPHPAHTAAGDAAKNLTRTTAPSLWISGREIVAPPYGKRVFDGSIAALEALAPLAHSSGRLLATAGTLIVGADRQIAAGVIAQAHGGSPALLDAAGNALAAGDRADGAGSRTSAVSSYAAAWSDAFGALTQLISTAATGVTPSALAAAADEALGSKKIALAGPEIEHKLKPLRRAGKPELFFAGAEGCPFCAVERWGMIVALSQFGSFSNLHLIQSVTTESPAIQTFTFLGSSYRSPYISFVPVEIVSNVPHGFGFESLQRLDPAHRALFKRFDRDGQTPFIDVANRFIRVDSTVEPDLIGGLSWNQIAGSLDNPARTSAQAIAGEAEVLTAELCDATDGKPAPVCSSKVVAEYQAALPLLNGKGGGCTATAASAAAVSAEAPPRARPARCFHR
jgi:hypothetical protein